MLVGARTRLRGRALDRELSRGADPASSETLRHRAAWLTGARHRRALARAVRKVRELGARRPAPITSAIPPDWKELTASRLELARIESTLEHVDRPVYCRGVAMMELLLTEGLSPLYYPSRRGQLRETLLSILDALEGR